MNVLVTAASRHGSTREIADEIGRVLRSEGCDADVRGVDEVRGVDGYDAVVLGSAVYMGRWLEPARTLAAEHGAELSARPTWLFSSGPVGDPPRPQPEEAVKVDEILAATGAAEHRLFAGKVDRGVLGFAERAVVRAVGAREGDYREWDEIRAWAAGIAESLRPAR